MLPRWVPRTFAFLATMASVFALSGAAQAQSTTTIYPPDPAHNLSLSSATYLQCANSPSSVSCMTDVLTSIDQARHQEGLGPLYLPTNWMHLSTAQQVFVSYNLERIARHEHPIAGLDPLLAAAAQKGADTNKDPLGPSGTITSASNWFGGSSVLEGLFEWMYNDGWGGSLSTTSNLVCTSPTASGCWGHRNNILLYWHTIFSNYPTSYTVVMNVGVAPQSLATLISAVPGSSPSLSYTWAQATAHGAGQSTSGWNPLKTPWPPGTQFVRINQSPRVYWVTPQGLWPIATPTAFAKLGGTPSAVVSVGTLASWTVHRQLVTNPPSDNRLVRVVGHPVVYWVHSHTLVPMANANAFNAMHFRWSAIQSIKALPPATPIASPLTTPPSSDPYPSGSFWKIPHTNPVYMVNSHHQLVHVPSMTQFRAWGGQWQNVHMVSALPPLNS